MTYDIIEELLSPYLEDELSPEEKKRVEDHLESCSSCSELLSFMRETQASLSDFPEIELSESLLDKIYAIPDQKKKFKIILDYLPRPSLQPILTAATILMVMFTFYYFNPNRSGINKTINRQVHLGYSQMEKLYAKAESFTDNLGHYKDNVLVSLKNVNPFGGNED